MEEILLNALTYSSIIWVVLSWIKLFINPSHPIYRFLCLKCTSFWVTLAFTWSIPTAAIAALIAAVIDNYLDNNINL